MNAHLTVRNLPEDLAAALSEEKQRRGTSLNQTVIDLLRMSLGVQQERDNGLGRLAGKWTEEQHQAFLKSIEPFSEIDEELWK